LQGEKVLIFKITQQAIFDRKHIPIIRDKWDVTVERVNLPWIEKLSGVVVFFEQNRFPRHFNLNPKHGENGVGNWTKESKLLCSRQEAQILLNSAIASPIVNELYNYDQTRKHFIVFKNEGFTPEINGVLQQQYHGYYPDNENEIEPKVRALLLELADLEL
jgi:hypothetical protein